ncbi:MAG: replication-associated recombination protein A [Bacteroidales bacterium]
MDVPNIPLAERLRPSLINDYVGQQHLLGLNAPLRRMLDSNHLVSFILWGPPGVGKTSLAQLIAHQQQRKFYTLSAVNAGVKDVREVIDSARRQHFFNTPNPILFIDEIHRFSKSQQDSLLGAVEQGTFILIGATTENPSFEIITPLLSRCQVYVLKSLEKEELSLLLQRAITVDTYLKTLAIEIIETDALFRFSGGDARKLLNILELLVSANVEPCLHITNELVINCLQENLAAYDKKGELHYDITSAFIKSMRGSDPNASVYWLARMIAGGEDPLFIARRMLILASEDIGLANPNALLMAQTCFESIKIIGMPEGRIILSQCAVYLATSPKSNSTYRAINDALSEVENSGNLPVPLHLRNAPTKLMKQLDYGKNYKYAHDYEQNFVAQEFMPDNLRQHTFFKPANNPKEIELKKQLSQQWKTKYKY